MSRSGEYAAGTRLWQSRFPAVNADRGKLLSYGYPAARILARLYLPGSFSAGPNLLLPRSRRAGTAHHAFFYIVLLNFSSNSVAQAQLLQRNRQSCRGASGCAAAQRISPAWSF